MPHTGGVANMLLEELTGMTFQFWLIFLHIFASCLTFLFTAIGIYVLKVKKRSEKDRNDL